MTRLAFAAILGATLAAACGGLTSPPPVGSRVGPAIVAALAAAEQTSEPWRCAAPDGPELTAETITAGNHHWLLAGHTLTLDPVAAPAAAGDVSIGAIADAAGSSPATLAALGRLRGKLGHADLVIALGGMGATRAELDAVLVALADRASWLLVAMPGDLEPAGALGEAVAAARARGAAVVDGRLVQRIALPGATIALVAGAGDTSWLVAGSDGCRYQTADAAKAFAELTPLPGLRIMATAEPPRTIAPGRPDPDEPTGDLAITATAGQEIDVALYGPTGIAASPARSGRRDGAAIALTPGSSSAEPRLDPRLDSSVPRPSAGVLTVRNGGWAWMPVEDK